MIAIPASDKLGMSFGLLRQSAKPGESSWLPFHRRQEMPDTPRIRQAGAIVFRLSGDTPEILLVRTRRDDAWIFPKGHIEAGEEIAEAALRKAREETGAVGALVALLEPPLTFRSGKEPVSVRYGLVRWLRTEEEHEPRRQQWASVAEAVALLTHPDARQLLGARCR